MCLSNILFDWPIKLPKLAILRKTRSSETALTHLIGVLLPQHPRYPLAEHLVPDLHTGRASASLAYGPAHYPFLTRTRQPVPYLSVSLNLHDLAMEVVVRQLGHAHVQPLPPALQLLDRLGTHARLPPPTPIRLSFIEFQ